MRGSRRRPVLAVLSAGLVGLLALALWLPLRAEGARLRREIREAQDRLSAEGRSATGVAQVAARIAGMRAQLGDLAKPVPADIELASLLGELSGCLDAQRVVDAKMEQKSIVPGPDYTVIPVGLTFRGTFPALFNIVRHIEAMPRPVRVNHLEVVQDDGAGAADPLHSVSIDLDTFASGPEGRRP